MNTGMTLHLYTVPILCTRLRLRSRHLCTVYLQFCISLNAVYTSLVVSSFFRAFNFKIPLLLVRRPQGLYPFKKLPKSLVSCIACSPLFLHLLLHDSRPLSLALSQKMQFLRNESLGITEIYLPCLYSLLTVENTKTKTRHAGVYGS